MEHHKKLEREGIDILKRASMSLEKRLLRCSCEADSPCKICCNDDKLIAEIIRVVDKFHTKKGAKE